MRKSTTVINTLMTPSSIATSSFPRKLPGKELHSVSGCLSQNDLRMPTNSISQDDSQIHWQLSQYDSQDAHYVRGGVARPRGTTKSGLGELPKIAFSLVSSYCIVGALFKTW